MCEQGRNFTNKIWNALRLINGWEIDENIAQPQYAQVAINWFNAKFEETFIQIEDHYDKYRLSDALMTTYKLIWDDFCSWYLEMIKPAYQHPIDKATYTATIELMEKLLKVLHPFMPFITEEIWHLLKERSENDNIIIAKMPTIKEPDKDIISKFDFALEIIQAIRTVRKEKNILNKETLTLYIKNNKEETADNRFDSIIQKLCNIEKLEYVDEKQNDMHTFMVRTTEIFIPLVENINVEEELKRLTTELEYYKGFRDNVMKKLSNERFVNSAPAQVVDLEKKKQSDAEQKIAVIEEQLKKLQINS